MTQFWSRRSSPPQHGSVGLKNKIKNNKKLKLPLRLHWHAHTCVFEFVFLWEIALKKNNSSVTLKSRKVESFLQTNLSPNWDIWVVRSRPTASLHECPGHWGQSTKQHCNLSVNLKQQSNTFLKCHEVWQEQNTSAFNVYTIKENTRCCVSTYS